MTQKTTTPTNASSAMAQLLANYKTKFVALNKGETVKGIITKFNRHEITVDVQAKSEALVLEKDRRILDTIMRLLKLGDSVEVSILSPESEAGMPIVSLRRYIDALLWDKLTALEKEQKSIDVTITDLTKGGYLITTEYGLAGFLPNSHISPSQAKDLGAGKTIKVTILELNRKDNKIIVSQKPRVSGEAFDAATKNLKKGDKVNATIANTTPFGVFVSYEVNGSVLDGLIHISEVSWEKVADLIGMFTPGEKIDAVVIGVDKDAKRIDFSLKRLSDDPFEAMKKQYPVDKEVTGTISKLDDMGAFLDLGNGVEGLIKRDKIPPTVTYTEGQEVACTVSDIDARKRRILLTPVLSAKPMFYR